MSPALQEAADTPPSRRPVNLFVSEAEQVADPLTAAE